MFKHSPERRRLWRRCVIAGQAFHSLQLLLWAVWTTGVLSRAYLYVRPALDAQEPVDLTGLVIHCVLAGLMGMLVLTLIEMRLEPWRFLDGGDV